MDKPKILIEQAGNQINAGHNISLKGDKRELVVMIAYVMKEVPEVAEAIVNSSALYLREHPDRLRDFVVIAGLV